MRRSIATTITVIAAALLGAGCAGPEKKLGRGIRNVTEPLRLGEMQRSIEQTALWEGPEKAYTTGLIRGINRTVARTALGVYEIATFPLPNGNEQGFDAILTPDAPLYPDPSIKTYRPNWGGLALPEDPVYTETYTPGPPASSISEADTFIGFEGGDVAPQVPGSRFRVF